MSANYAQVHHEVTGGRDNDTIREAPIASSTGDATVSDRELTSVDPATTSIEQPSGPLSSTTGPFQQSTTEDVSKSDVPPSSSVDSQNAPGKGGRIGENAMGAFGYGGAQVERPREEQGIAEKIVNLLGA